ncbi:MAG: hypothetical protein L0226_00455 [Acidobacteria bacterium]|nr:hypothetical protein [Acidobacteriota bacterium]
MPRKKLISEQAALYALDLLATDEARAFEQLVTECFDDGARVLKEFELVVGCIGFTAPEQTPPAAIREKLLARIDLEMEKRRIRNKRK